MFQPEKVLQAPRVIDYRQPGTLLHQQKHRIGRVRPANTDPLCDAAELDSLKRIDLHVIPPSAASDNVCLRDSAPHAPGVPPPSRFPRQTAPAARINHDDVTSSWSGPPRCDIVVVARDSAL